MFSVKFHQIAGLVPPECTTKSAAAARRMALDALRSGAARRAEVRDAEGNVILDVTNPADAD